jgi:hypothetical protein
MATKQVISFNDSSTPVIVADTNASANTLVMRDSSKNVAGNLQTNVTTATTNTFINPVPVIQTGNFSAAVDTDMYECDATGGAIAATLPAAASCPGREYTFIRISASNNVTVTGNGAETIDGANTYVLSAQWQTVRIRSNGTSWRRVA